MNELAIKSPNIKATQYGIEFTGNPSIKEWYQAVQAVQRVNGMCQWYLGDLIVYAESPVTGWGESKYNDLLDATGYDYGTLANFASVARRFGTDFRKNVSLQGEMFSNVSFTHFKAVTSLSDEKAFYFLEMVRDGGWSVAKLREEIARYKNGGTLPKPKEEEELEELPDGFVRAKSSDTYVPVPVSVGSAEQYRPTFKVELYDWEAKSVLRYIKNDSKLVSLTERLALALEGG